VFLLGGQSNAVGLGKTNEVPTSPVNLRQPQPDVLFYANGPTPALTTLRPGSGVDFGPELSFGRAIADASPGVTYAIIKHAEGGTGLWDDWVPSTGPSYTNFRNTVTAGLAALQAAGYTTEIVGMVWHQGESDALEGYQAAYQTNLRNFIADVRTRYGANLRFLIGEIGNKYTPTLAALSTVIAAQQAVAAADRNAQFVPAKDLTFQDDLHFDTAGMITLGERFAATYASRIPRLADAGFEYPVQPTNGYKLGDGSGTGSLVGSAWSFGTQPSGITQNGSAFGPPTAPEGTQAAILRGTDTIATTVEGFEAGVTYRFALSAAGRTGTPNNFQVVLGGTPLTFGGLTTVTPSVGSYTNYTSDYFTTSGGSLVLELKGAIAGDQTAFLDHLRFLFIAEAVTPETPILIANQGASNIGSTSATLNALLITPETNADVYAYWGTTDGGTNPGAWSHSALVGSWTNEDASDIAFNATGLASNTPYYFTFRATNATEDVWATPSLAFTTLVPGTAENLLTALLALKAHINGSTPLNSAQITAHCQTIIASKGFFDANTNVVTAARDLVQTYDTLVGPLFVAGSPKASGFTRSSVVPDQHWAVYNTMQGLMDDVFTAENLATYNALLTNYKFGSSANFPGACAPPADSNNAHVATIDASFVDTDGWPVFQWAEPARKPTGTYLAPGTYAYVTTPSSLVNQGYRIRVGAHGWDLSSRPEVKRLDRSTVAYHITSETTKIASPLGGGIYIEVPLGANKGVVNVSIQGAVRSPFFSLKSFHTTTPTQWLTERAHSAPWADFQSGKYMMQVPRSWIYNLPDPTAMMQKWDSAQDSVNDLMGFPRIRGKESMYSQVDVIIRSSANAPGYPMVNTTYNPNTNYGGNYNHFLVRGPDTITDACSTEFHEQGHGYLFPKFAGEIESSVNLLYLPVLLNLGVNMDTAFHATALTDSAVSATNSRNNTAINWMTVFNFSAPSSPMASGHKSYQLKGHAKFADLIALFGVQAVNKFFKSYVDDYNAGTPKNSLDTGHDEMIFRLCVAAGWDVRPLLHVWGIWPQNNATLGARIATANLYQSAAIYQRLQHYRSLVPADHAAFQSFCQTWYGRTPVYTGKPWAERDHARQFNSTAIWATAGEIYSGTDSNQADGEIYNPNTRNRIVAVIDGVLASYFPSGDPALLNESPRFISDPVVGPNAVEDAAYSGTLAASASDPEGDPMTFSKLSGPAWLTVGSNGALSGTPANSDVGLNAFTVQVSDGAMLHTATLNITVVNVNDAPTWNTNPIAGVAANANTAYNATLAGLATDVDAGASLAFAKVSGPSWLSVAANGALTGTPAAENQGENVFTVSVSDGIAAPVVATLNITVNAPLVIVPDVVGLPLASAESNLAAASYIVGTVTTQFSASVAFGSVISQNPAAGSSLVQGGAVALVASRGPAPENTPLLANPNFDPPAEVTSDNDANGYGPLSSWAQSSGASGVNATGQPFLGSQTPPSGTHVAFIQSSGNISQSLTGFDPTKLYSVSYFVSERGMTGAATSTSVSLNGGAASFAQPGNIVKTDKFRRIVSGPLAVSGTTSTLQIAATGVAADNTLLIDSVRLTRAVPQVPDGGFENPVQPGTGLAGFKMGNTSGSGTLAGSLWNFGATFNGITRNGSSYSTLTVDHAPEGSQAALLLGIGEFSTTANGFEPGVTYSLSFAAKGRGSSLGPNMLQIQLNGQVLTVAGIPSITPGQSAWTSYTTDPFTTLGGNLPLKVIGLTDGDKTTFLDDFRFNFLAESPDNLPPAFLTDPVVKADATQDIAYSGTLATDATDANGDPLSFAKVSGLGWLLVAPDGTLSGTPGAGNVGVNPFTVSVSDGFSPPVVATLTITVVTADDNFATWISNPDFGIDPGDQGFGDDPDGDGLSNGIEAWFGTHPGQFNASLTEPAKNGNTFTFTHPHNQDAPGDVNGFYEWSPNLVDWYSGNGVGGPPGGPTVAITSETTGATTTVTATTSGTTSRVFVRAGVIQND
jgi:hypothetical protein